MSIIETLPLPKVTITAAIATNQANAFENKIY